MSEARAGRPPGTPKTGGRQKGSRNRPKLPPAVTTDVAAGAEAAGGAPPASALPTSRARARDDDPKRRGPGRPPTKSLGDFPKHRIMRVDGLIPYVNNARTHSPAQIAKIAASIKEFGFTNPVLTDGRRGIVAGHGRVLAAQKLGMDTVPTIELSHLSKAQRRAYVIADNKLAEASGWDDELLELELGELRDDGFDLALIGFDPGELVTLLGDDHDPASDAIDDPDINANVRCPECGHEFPTIAKAFRRIAAKRPKAA